MNRERYADEDVYEGPDMYLGDEDDDVELDVQLSIEDQLEDLEDGIEDSGDTEQDEMNPLIQIFLCM